jgi:hypothetical protein
MSDTSTYEPFIVAAANRQMVRLHDGRTGRLIWWSKHGESATVIIAGRHIRIHHHDLAEIVDG